MSVKPPRMERFDVLLRRLLRVPKKAIVKHLENAQNQRRKQRENEAKSDA